MGASPTRAMPVYMSLLEELRSLIRTRVELDGNDDWSMPTDADLCAQFGVSRQTVRRAYQELVAEGAVYRVAGRGTFIARRAAEGRPYYRSFGSVEDIYDMVLDTDMRVLSPFTTEINESIASELQTGSDHTVVSVELIRLHEGRAISAAKVYLPPALGQAVMKSGLPESGRTSILATVLDAAGVSVSTVEQEITAVACPLHISTLLNVQPGQPMLLVRRLYLDSSGRPIELAVNYHDPSAYAHRVVLGTGSR